MSEGSVMTFKQEHDLEKRKAESAAIRQKYPDRVPVIVEKAKRRDAPNIENKKFLVRGDITVGQFVNVIRKRLALPSDKALFVIVNKTLPVTAALMSTIDENHKDEDGYVYFTYAVENTFGSV